jgi:hypothetical protein
VFQIAAPEEGGCFEADRGFKAITIDCGILQGRSNQEPGGIKGHWDLKRTGPGYRCLDSMKMPRKKGRMPRKDLMKDGPRLIKHPHVKLNPKHDYKCRWWHMDHSATQMEIMEKDTGFPERYKEMFRGASVGTVTELDSVENLHFPEEKTGCTVPMKFRVSFPDRRDQQSLVYSEGAHHRTSEVSQKQKKKTAGRAICA